MPFLYISIGAILGGLVVETIRGTQLILLTADYKIVETDCRKLSQIVTCCIPDEKLEEVLVSEGAVLYKDV